MPSRINKSAPPQNKTDAIQTQVQALSQELNDLIIAQLAAHWDEQINSQTKTLEEQRIVYETISAQILEAQKILQVLQKQVNNLLKEMNENYNQIHRLVAENQCLMEKLEETKTAFDHLLKNNFSLEKSLEKNAACRDIERLHFNNLLTINHLNIQQKELLPQRISSEHNKTQQVEYLETLQQQAIEAEKNYQHSHITLNHLSTEKIHAQKRIDYLKKEIAQLQEEHKPKSI